MDNGYFNIVKLCIPVHDETNVEAPSEIGELVKDTIQTIMREEARPFLQSLELDADESRFSVCVNDYSHDGTVIAHKGDIVCINEHSFHNVTEDRRYPIVIKDKSCFDSNGPLPTYWIH